MRFLPKVPSVTSSLIIPAAAADLRIRTRNLTKRNAEKRMQKKCPGPFRPPQEWTFFLKYKKTICPLSRLPTGTRALCNRCPASMDNIIFLFSRLKIKNCCPRGRGQTEPIPARVLSVGFRQEAVSWQREAWRPEPTSQGRRNRKLERAGYQKVPPSSQTNANHCLALNLCLCWKGIEVVSG